MANYVVNGESLTAIAAAIREKTGNSAKLSLAEMPDAIRSIVNNYKTAICGQAICGKTICGEGN